MTGQHQAGAVRRRLRVAAPSARVEARPTVSVIIPCFNYARFLPEAVTSVLDQEGTAVDVIIVDDHSSDDSLNVARRLAAADSRVQVIAHEQNLGAVATFNDGLPAVTGEFLVRLDADDLLTPGSLTRSTALMIAHPSVGLAYGRPRHFSDQLPAHRSKVSGWTVWPGEQWLAGRTRDAENVITSPEVLMRTTLVQRLGGQLPLKHTHDMEMWMRLAAFADVGYVRGADQAFHREHAGSLSTTMADPLADLDERRAAFQALFDGPAGQLPTATRLRTRALRSLAIQALDRASNTFDRGRPSDELTARLIAWALETDESVRSSTHWSALHRRIDLGPARVGRRPWYRLAPVRRRLRNEHRRLNWNRHGTYDGR